ncbi:MAG: AAA family ATPase [Rhodobacteraceae bacterium]|nr:AAA family ATPase [Paracoccaceae bacterium]
MAQLRFDQSAEHALERMRQGVGNLFITGRAGTGKSTLLLHYLKERPRNAAVVAPTGVAALRVGGQTIHSFFGFSVDVTPDSIERIRPRRRQLYRSLLMLIIDEVSMLRADLHDCIDLFLRKFGPEPGTAFGGVQMVYFGDLYQLPPVVTDAESSIFSEFYATPYFFSAMALHDTGLETIELETVHRQRDDEFIGILNNIRDNSVTDCDLSALNKRLDPGFESPEGSHYVTLTSTNARADAINERQLAKLPGNPHQSPAEITGDFTRNYFPAPPMLDYKIGAQIMMLTNDPQQRWLNGTAGVITGIHTDSDSEVVVGISLPGQDSPIRIGRHSWDLFKFELNGSRIDAVPVGQFRQLPFRLAWALTIHKCQGLTLENAIIDLTSVFSPGQTYVALSRCRTLDDIVLTRRIEHRHIFTDRRLRCLP